MQLGDSPACRQRRKVVARQLVDSTQRLPTVQDTPEDNSPTAALLINRTEPLSDAPPKFRSSGTYKLVYWPLSPALTCVRALCVRACVRNNNNNNNIYTNIYVYGKHFTWRARCRCVFIFQLISLASASIIGQRPSAAGPSSDTLLCKQKRYSYQESFFHTETPTAARRRARQRIGRRPATPTTAVAARSGPLPVLSPSLTDVQTTR